MSSPHPPIPEPQSAPGAAHSDDDGPRTQSILLPPSQRQARATGEIPLADPAAQDAAVPESATPAQSPAAGQYVPGAGSALPPPSSGQFPRPDLDPAAPSRATGPVDFVPGFGERPAAGSSAAPPPVPGPSTTPGSPFNAPTTGRPPADHSAGRPSARERRSPMATLPRGGRAGAALVSLGLGVLALVLLEIGLVREFGNQSLWDVVPTWSTFATAAVLLVLVPAVAGLTGKLSHRTAWRVGAGGLAALVVAWVLVALPLAASDRGFWLTTAVLAAGAALWLAPGRTE
jgi:hypothetical protein